MAEEKQKPGVRKGSSLNGSVPLSDILFMTLRRWPWLLLSVAVCVGAAYFKLLRTPDVYTRSAEIMIKDSSKGKSAGAEYFSDFGLIQNKIVLKDEITNLQSIDLMEEVVRRLNLDMNYFRFGRFHDEVAYGLDLPVKVTTGNFPDQDSFSMTLEVAGDGAVKISDLTASGQEVGTGKYSGRLNDSINTPIGKIIVTPTDVYKRGEKVKLGVRKIPVSSATGSYAGRLGIALEDEKGRTISLSMSDQSVQRADDVLSMVISVYNENWIRDRNQVAVSTAEFINDRLNVIENELGNVDSDISSFKSAALTPDLGAAASMYMNQSQQNQATIFELNNQLAMARYIRSYLVSDANRDQLLPTNSGYQSSNVGSLIGAYNEKMLQRNTLLAKSSLENPLIVQLDDQLAQQRQAMVRTIDNEIVQINTLLSSIRGREAATVSKLASNPNQAKNLLSVERQQKVKESLYLFLLQKREESQLSQAFTAYNTQIINRPHAAGGPPIPNRRNILTMALLVGLAIPFGFSFIKETFNTKVRGRKDVEDLKAPFLGEIPQYFGNRKKDKFGRNVQVKAIVVKPGARDIINEAFRVLRTNLEFMKVHKDEADVMAITSFNPGSGKSFLTMNLGVALALNDQRTLVIDGDMRHGSASAYIDFPEKGLSDVLANNVANVTDVIVKDKNVPHLSILPIGTVPPNPTELLKSKRFSAVLDELRKQYDYILIDCPPIEVVADAQIIDRHSDRTVFVLRAGLLERSMLTQVDRLYDEDKYRNMCVILNGTDSGHGRYGHYHSYKYGYGYGYGNGYHYGSKGLDGKSKSNKNSGWAKNS